MQQKLKLIRLDKFGRIYALQDEKGQIIGTGTREVCEVLVNIICNPSRVATSPVVRVGKRPNIRAAIGI
ncbi:MAG: hypothetical protein ABR555_15300 [Pyrinomonadaceae bacterium]